MAGQTPAVTTYLVEVNHEGGQSNGDTLQRPDAGEDVIGQPDQRRLGRHIATNVGHEHNDSYLQVAQVI